MGLKIVTQIGTDKGITSEAYVRITDYQINKNGSSNFRIEIFQKQEDSVTLVSPAVHSETTARNKQIGDTLNISLTKETTETVKVKKLVPTQVEKTIKISGPLDENGNNTLIDQKVMTWETQENEVVETITKTVPDLTPLENVTIFEFAYGKLKEKLVELFGDKNIIDC